MFGNSVETFPSMINEELSRRHKKKLRNAHHRESRDSGRRQRTRKTNQGQKEQENYRGGKTGTIHKGKGSLLSR